MIGRLTAGGCQVVNTRPTADVSIGRMEPIRTLTATGRQGAAKRRIIGPSGLQIAANTVSFSATESSLRTGVSSRT